LGRSLGLFILGEADALWLDTDAAGAVSRVGGTLGHANSLAMFLEMQLPIVLSLSIARDVAIGNRNRVLLLSAFVLGSITLAMTFSRSAWLSLAVAAVLVFIFHFRDLKLTVRQLVLGGSAGIVAMAGLVLLRDPIVRRLEASTSASFTFRSNLIVISQNMIKQHPWLGIGLNNFTLVMNEYDTIGFTDWRVTPVHNLFFLTAAETGIVGLIAFLWLLVGVFSEGWKILRTKVPFLTSLTAGILAGLIAALVHSNLGWLWRYDVVYIQFWFLVGYMLSFKNLLDSSQRPYSDGLVA
jgi:O-antigen ligase